MQERTPATPAPASGLLSDRAYAALRDRLISLQKRSLREQGFIGTSPMPSYRDTLTVQEIDDLVGYLVSLRGFNP